MNNYLDTEEVVGLREVLEQEMHNLDIFNLEVAKFRVEHGFSDSMMHLYGAMGRLCTKLQSLEAEVESIEGYWKSITTIFQVMRERREADDKAEVFLGRWV